MSGHLDNPPPLILSPHRPPSGTPAGYSNWETNTSPYQWIEAPRTPNSLKSWGTQVLPQSHEIAEGGLHHTLRYGNVDQHNAGRSPGRWRCTRVYEMEQHHRVWNQDRASPVREKQSLNDEMAKIRHQISEMQETIYQQEKRTDVAERRCRELEFLLKESEHARQKLQTELWDKDRQLAEELGQRLAHLEIHTNEERKLHTVITQLKQNRTNESRSGNERRMEDVLSENQVLHSRWQEELKLRTQNQSRILELEQLIRKLENSNQTRQLEEELRETRQSNSILRDQVRDLENKLNDFKRRSEHYETRETGDNQQIIHLRQQLESVRMELDNQVGMERQKIRQLEDELREKTLMLEKLTRDIQSAMQERTHTIKLLEEELESKDKKLMEQMSLRVSQLEAHVDQEQTQHQTIQRLREELEQSKRDLNSFEASVHGEREARRLDDIRTREKDNRILDLQEKLDNCQMRLRELEIIHQNKLREIEQMNIRSMNEKSHVETIERYIEIPVEKVVEIPVDVVVEVPIPVERLVEKIVEVQKPVDRYIEKIVEVEKWVEIPVEIEVPIEVPVETLIEKIIEVPVEKIIEVKVPHYIEKVVEKVVEIPSETIIEKIVEIPVERVVEKIITVPNPNNKYY